MALSPTMQPAQQQQQQHHAFNNGALSISTARQQSTMEQQQQLSYEGAEPTSQDSILKVTHLPVDISPREFRLMFTFCKGVVSAEYHAATMTGYVFFSRLDAAIDARDVLTSRRSDDAYSVVADLISPHGPLSSSNSSTGSINGRRHSPPINQLGSMHISPQQRPMSFSPPKKSLSVSTGKQIILGEENDNINAMLSPSEELLNDVDFERPGMPRRQSNHNVFSNGLNGINAYPPPLASPGLVNHNPLSPGVAPPSGLLNGGSQFSATVMPRSSTPPMPMHHFSHHSYPRILPAANPADQNPPCNTLYVGNLPMNTSEEELKALFSRQRGYKRLCFRTKSNGPMCFVEFEDVAYATRALTELYGRGLSNSVKGGIRLSFSKNPLGVRNDSNDRRNSAMHGAIPGGIRMPY